MIVGKAEAGEIVFILSLGILKWISSGPLLEFVTEKRLINATSKAPISQASPCGRVTPRWSVGVHVLLSPASIAGLSARSAIVSVSPPLSARESSLGSVEVPGQLFSTGQLKLLPKSTTEPPQLLKPVPERIELPTCRSPPCSG